MKGEGGEGVKFLLNSVCFYLTYLSVCAFLCVCVSVLVFPTYLSPKTSFYQQSEDIWKLGPFFPESNLDLDKLEEDKF